MKVVVSLKSNDDIFVFEEFPDTEKKPVMVARCSGMEDLLSEIGKITGNDISVNKYFGDYITKIMMA